MYNKKDYDRFEFIKHKLFIITNLDSGRLHNKVSKYEDRSLTIFSAVSGVFILFGLFAYPTIMELTGLSVLSTLLILAVLDVIVSFLIIIHVHYHINERVRERTLSEDGNVKFDLSKVWKINPGGIQEDIKLNTGTTVSVRYTSNAIILRGIMKGVIDCESDADRKHYSVMQRLVDIAMREGYELSIFNLPYNIDNDPIWESEAEKIFRTSSDLGNDYTVLMTTLHNHIYEYTSKNSKVTVVYYVLKNKVGYSHRIESIANEIIKLNKQCQMNITGISMKEFKNFLEGYYGINISIEDITSFMTTTSIDLGECKIISYIDENNHLINMNKIFDYDIPSLFTTIDFGDSLKVNQEDDDTTEKSLEYTEDTNPTIFDRDII